MLINHYSCIYNKIQHNTTLLYIIITQIKEILRYYKNARRKNYLT